MINSLYIAHLRNAEYFQFISSARDIFAQSEIDREYFGALYDELEELLKAAENAMAFEKKSEKVREKNEADRYRDRLHSKLFNYLKSILYDERDVRCDDAQAVMKVVREAGNPTKLAENAESALLTALGNKLEPFRSQLESIGAQQILDDLMEANRRFIALETECRAIIAAQKISNVPLSMSAVRKQIDPLYRSIINAINGFCNIPSKREAYREFITDMNVLVARYDATLAGRKTEKKDRKTETCETCGK